MNFDTLHEKGGGAELDRRVGLRAAACMVMANERDSRVAVARMCMCAQKY